MCRYLITYKEQRLYQTLRSTKVIKKLPKVMRLRAANLEIGIHCKFKLFDKNPFKNADIILFIENQHRFFVINGIHSAERNGTISVGH
jgi:hypothetical protein